MLRTYFMILARLTCFFKRCIPTEIQESSSISLSLPLPAPKSCLSSSSQLYLQNTFPVSYLSIFPTTIPFGIAIICHSNPWAGPSVISWLPLLFPNMVHLFFTHQSQKNPIYILSHLKFFPWLPSSFGIKPQAINITYSDTLVGVVLNTLYWSTSCAQPVQLSPFLTPPTVLAFFLLLQHISLSALETLHSHPFGLKHPPPCSCHG